MNLISKAATAGSAILKSPGRLLLALTALSCLLLVFTVPPFQAPDEQQHFYRSYSLSSGIVMPERRGETVGAVLPSSLPLTVDTFLHSRELHTYRPVNKVRWSDQERELQRPVDPAVREFVVFSDAGLVGPIAHVPQAIGMTIGRAFDLSPLKLLYCARLANTLFSLMICWFGLRRLTGELTWSHCILALPMAQSQFACASPDATMIAAGLTLTSCLVSRLTTPKAELGNWAILTLAAAVLVSAKAAYVGVPVLAAVVAVYRGVRLGMPRRAVAFGAGLFCVTLAVAAIWAVVAQNLAVVTHPLDRGFQPVDQAAQIAFVLGNPLSFLKALVVTGTSGALFYATSTIGILGWLSVPIWAPIYLGALLALILAFTSAPPQGPWPIWIRLLTVGAVLGSWALFELALYIRWTTVGAPMIEGVQGRYLLPFMFLLTLAQTPIGTKLLSPQIRSTAIVALLAVTIIAAQVAVIAAYY